MARGSKSKSNVVSFASCAASVKEKRTISATAQRQRELAFKLVAEGKKASKPATTTDALIQDGLEWRLIADSLGRSSKIWRSLYLKSERALKSANKKIAKLEAQLERSRLRSA